MVFKIRRVSAFFWIVLVFFIVGCQAFNRTDTQGTLEAQNLIYNTQAVVIQTDSLISRTNVAGTIQSAQTEIAGAESVNGQLLATIRAGSTPTIAVVAGVAAGVSPNLSSTQEFLIVQGNLQFILTGLSDSVSSIDGCVINPQTNFFTTQSRIYATVQAFNILAQTLMEVEWFRGGELVYSDSWRVADNHDQICIWFYIQATDVTFTEGQWSVQFSANGSPIQQPMSFTFVEDMDDMSDG